MVTRSSRFRFVLVEESAELPVVYQRRTQGRVFPPAPPRRLAALSTLMEAFAQLDMRGPGSSAWATPLSTNPLSFLLDSMSDAVFVRQSSGEVVFKNRAAASMPIIDRPPVAAEQVFIGPRCYERRCLVMEDDSHQLIIEVLSIISEEDRR